jgi:tungstate transport system ATP-binding protein
VSVPEAILSAADLRVELGGMPVLDIPSFQLYEKEILTIVGPNGSGKSTLLLTLACLLKPLSGTISYRGDLLNSREVGFRFRRKISMVFQEPLLFDTTVYKNVASGLKIRGRSRSDCEEQVMKYLKYFHCDHLAHRSARKLSGGESQRTSLARAFAVEPEILFLDEPFSALDPPTRRALTQDLNKIVKETGTTTLMVTHLESEALNMSSRIMVMNGGRIVQTGGPSDVMNNPSNEFVARFVGMQNVLPGKITASHGEFLAISVFGREIYAAGQAQADENVNCCIRPENIAVYTGDAGALSSAINVFPGVITHVYSMGPFVELTLNCGFLLESIVTQEAFTNLELSEGKQIHASFSPASVHLMRF